MIGKYDGTYSNWLDFTSFTGADSLNLTIKKADSKYYFFINNVQVYTHSYSSLIYDGIGFTLSDSRIKADYLYIDQKDYKKSEDTESIELESFPGGQISVKSLNRK